MKTKELIRRLQEADPTGEAECCVGNTDIYFVEPLPAYYDGNIEVLEHDPRLRDRAWSVVGAKVTTKGVKVQIHTLSILDAIDMKPDLPVDLSEAWDLTRIHYEESLKKAREEAREDLRRILEEP